MADLNVERKERSIWPWILGLLVLAALIWALVSMLDNEDEAEVVPATETEVVVPATDTAF